MSFCNCILKYAILFAMDFASNFQTKEDYREYAKKIRADLDNAKISAFIIKYIQAQSFYRKAKNILGFYPTNSEINIIELFKDNTKNWFLPSIDVHTKELFVHSYKHGDPLEKNLFGVLEPAFQSDESPEIVDLVIVPALMVDKNGYRLGYGAGYYDRFLPSLKISCVKVVPLPETLFVRDFPHESFDVPVDAVVTELRTIKINKNI